MRSVSLTDIVLALRSVGITVGDIVNVHSRLHAIGTIDGVAIAQIPETYVKAFFEVLGEAGTIVVPTFTTSFGRFGTPFVLEASPSEFGVLSEYVRRARGSRRTFHPIDSLAALGAQAEYLTRDHPPWNVGYDTIWSRMLKKGAKIASVGLPLKNSMSFVHQVELLACVPYLYHKRLRGEVYAEGVRVQHDFFMAVRYLQYNVAYDLSRLQQQLVAKGAIRKALLGGDFVWGVAMEDVFAVTMDELRKDPYYLLKAPPTFVEGEIPCDETTIGREGRAPRYFLA